jgi:hypothetical protein
MKKIDVWDRMLDTAKLDRFILFAWHNYYPSGAYGDMQATGNCKTTLKHYAFDELSQNYVHFKILDMDERKWLNLEDF